LCVDNSGTGGENCISDLTSIGCLCESSTDTAVLPDCED
jgi:hypothetical protein